MSISPSIRNLPEDLIGPIISKIDLEMLDKLSLSQFSHRIRSMKILHPCSSMRFNYTPAYKDLASFIQFIEVCLLNLSPESLIIHARSVKMSSWLYGKLIKILSSCRRLREFDFSIAPDKCEVLDSNLFAVDVSSVKLSSLSYHLDSLCLQIRNPLLGNLKVLEMEKVELKRNCGQALLLELPVIQEVTIRNCQHANIICFTLVAPVVKVLSVCNDLSVSTNEFCSLRLLVDGIDCLVLRGSLYVSYQFDDVKVLHGEVCFETSPNADRFDSMLKGLRNCRRLWIRANLSGRKLCTLKNIIYEFPLMTELLLSGNNHILKEELLKKVQTEGKVICL